MPYVTDDDSKAAKRIAEIERQLQEARADFERWLAGDKTPTSAAELVQGEREGKALSDRLQALATALKLQAPWPAWRCTSRSGSWPKPRRRR